LSIVVTPTSYASRTPQIESGAALTGLLLLQGKLLCSEVGVQLIVFLAAIKENLKTKIYGRDKKYFCSMKTKGQFETGSRV